LEEDSLIGSSAETLEVSIDDIEEKFNLGQLIMFSQIQKISYENVQKSGKTGKIINKGNTPEERNKNAWKYL